MIVTDMLYLNQSGMKNSVMYCKFFQQQNRIKIVAVSAFV